MSNALITTEKFPILAAGSREAQILAANLGDSQVYESDLTLVKMPTGGSTEFSYERPDGKTVSTDTLEGVLVATAGRGVLWPTREMGDQRPLVVTHDLKVGHKVGDDFGDIAPETLDKFLNDDGTYDWAAMSNSAEFGFGSAGRGKRVKESQIIAILQPGETWPVLLRITGGSLTVWSKFRKMLPCLPHEAIVSFRLEKTKNMGGQTFSRIKPALVGQLSIEEGAVVERLYTESLTAMLTRAPGSGAPVGDEEVPF